jgi:hypothetical protein
LYGAKSIPIISTGNGFFADTLGNKILFNRSDTSFIWFGGSYFNNPRLFEINTPIDSKALTKYSGVFFSRELGKLTLKYHQKSEKIKIKTSFGIQPKVQTNGNKFIQTDQDYDIILLNENLILLGNKLVRVEFERMR